MAAGVNLYNPGMADRMSAPTQTKVRARAFQFRLSTLLIFVGGFAVWPAVVSYHANLQKRAVEVIKASGGEVRYDFEYDRNLDRRTDDPAPPGPDWLRNVIGVDYFASVTCVDFRNADDRSLAAVAGLPNLRALVLTGDLNVTDAGLGWLAKNYQLEELRIDGCRNLTDAGLKHLRGLKSLWGLATSGTDITPKGVRELAASIPSLESDYFMCRNPLSPSPGTGHIRPLRPPNF